MAVPRTLGWEKSLLRSLGAPPTSQNLLFLDDWARAEGGGAENNPFNTTQPGFGSIGKYNRVGVQRYDTPQHGLAATLATLNNGRYGNILAALKNGSSAVSAAQALAASPWGTGSLVLKMLGASPAVASAPVSASAPAPRPTPSPAPTVDYRPLLASRLAAAAGSPANDLTNFYSTLRQALLARAAAAQAQPPVQPQPRSVVAGQDVTLPTARRGELTGNLAGEQQAFLNRLAALAGYEGQPIAINSGYRSTARQAQLYANRASNPNPVAPPGHSLHERGLAADGTIGGKPLGTLPAALLRRFGLQTVPGDPVHIQAAR